MPLTDDDLEDAYVEAYDIPHHTGHGAGLRNVAKEARRLALLEAANYFIHRNVTWDAVQSKLRQMAEEGE